MKKIRAHGAMDDSALRSRWSFACLSLGVAAIAMSPHNAHAGALTGPPSLQAGPTPFIETLTSNYSGGTLQSVGYSIQPMAGSLTRPFAITYPASYLATTGGLASSGTAVTFSVFGLYAGTTNVVNLSFTFTDGSVVTQPVMITTAAYSDPCTALNMPTFAQNRTTTNQLNFDYILLKDDCSTASPAIADTDGNFRWVGTAGIAAEASILYNNGIYISNGSAIDRVELTTGAVTKLADYYANTVTYTGHHNIDPGRDGLMLDVNTLTEHESVNIEVDPITGAILNTWDMGQIISAAMTAGGDNPALLDLDLANAQTDWFHNNASVYNPADNTLIVSSRENFVMAVDYDTPADGQKKIHWILGDQTKNWGQFKSLTKYALTLSGANAQPPVGQHGISIDHLGNLLLFDDGAASIVQVPAGVTLPHSSVQEYIINTTEMTATGGYYWSPNPALTNQYCGSVYDVNGTFLVDEPDLAGGLVELWGLDTGNNTVFNLQYTAGICGIWNAMPMQTPVASFAPTFTLAPAASTVSQLAPTAAILTVPQGASSSDVISVNPDFGFDSSVSFTLSGLPPGVTALPAGITGSLSPSSSLTGTTLTVSAASTAALGYYPIRVTGTSGSAQFSATVTVLVTGKGLTAQTITFGAIANQTVGTVLGLTATASSGLTVSYVSTTPTACTVTGSTATLLAAGPCAITASQAGNGSYAAAIPVSQTFTVNAATLMAQTITFGTIATQTAGTMLGLTATASSGLPVSYVSTTASVCTVTGSTATLLAAGPCTITAAQSGNGTYAAAASVSQTFTVNAAASGGGGGTSVSLAGVDTVYALANLNTPTVGGGFDGSGNSYAANLLGSSVTWSGSTFALGSATTVSAAAAKTITLPAGNYSSLQFLASAANGPFLNQVFTVTYTDGTTSTLTQNISDWVHPQNYPGESIAATTAYRITSSGAAQIKTCYVYGYSIILNKNKIVSSLTLSSSRNVIVLALDLVQSAVGGVTQTISFGAIAAQTAGTTLGLTAQASSGLTVSYVSTTPSVCTVTGSTASLLAAGACTITASQAGNSSYAAATSVSQTFTVNAAVSGGGGTSVSLAGVDSVYALANLNSPTVGGGFDGSGNSYAANLLGSLITWSGNTFTLGSAATVSGAAEKNITLPAGNYSSLQFLASAANGPFLNQVFTVTYTDGTTSTLTQNISDWVHPQNYAGESIAATTAYRITSSGAAQTRTCDVYGYSITLNKSKVVSFLTLPSSRNVIVLAVDLNP